MRGFPPCRELWRSRNPLWDKRGDETSGSMRYAAKKIGYPKKCSNPYKGHTQKTNSDRFMRISSPNPQLILGPYLAKPWHVIKTLCLFEATHKQIAGPTLKPTQHTKNKHVKNSQNIHPMCTCLGYVLPPLRVNVTGSLQVTSSNCFRIWVCLMGCTLVSLQPPKSG